MKIRTAIVQATVNAPTFQDVSFEPSLVNFFYGRNGSGKTTLARAIQEKQSLTWAREDDAALPIYLYNNDFIRRNVASYDRLDGVFTLSETNADIVARLDEKAKQKQAAEAALQTVLEAIGRARTEAAEALDSHQKTLWRQTADIRRKYPACIPADAQQSVSAFADALQLCDPKSSSEQELDSAYTAYAKEHPDYNPYLPLPDDLPPELDLDIPLVPRGESGFAAFVRALGSLDWLRSGHEQFAHQAGGKCPYCQQTLPEDFEQRLASCYDQQYQEAYQRLTAQISAYREYLSTISSILSANAENPFPGPLASKYRRTADLLAAKLRAAEQTLERKLRAPAEELRLDEYQPLVNELSLLTVEINGKIDAYMRLLSDLPGQQQKCRERVWRHMAALCEPERLRYTAAEQQQAANLKTLEAEQKRLEAELRMLSDEITALDQAAVNTTDAMNAINQMLAGNGFTGFSLRVKPGEKYRYELVRTVADGTSDDSTAGGTTTDDTADATAAGTAADATADGTIIAQGLSEGERHLIAFLYFYHLVMGSSNADGSLEDKIVIIDDPVSSMDSCTLSTVAALTREMISVCRDNATRARRPISGHLKQFFCLTHNPVYFRAVSFPCLSDYESCSFFEVRKDRDNRSSIVLCEEEVFPGRALVNVSPITNDYEYLWREYARTDDPAVLINVCRRILSAYFLQTCGHPETDLQAALLDGNQGGFIQKDGSPDRTAYSIASAMVSLLDAGGNGVIDGVYYDVTACDADQLRHVFHRIFEILHSGQHYDYMMRHLGRE